MAKKIDIKEFREKGFLQEANRLFFHPLGLALEVKVDENGNEFLSGVWDYRDDKLGIIYDDGILSKTKADNVKALKDSKSAERLVELGYIIQPVK